MQIFHDFYLSLFQPEYVYRPDSGNSGNSGRNKTVHSPEFFMTCSVPVFGTDRNIPTVPTGTERNLELSLPLRRKGFTAAKPEKAKLMHRIRRNEG